jgi:hypothetical protein
MLIGWQTAFCLLPAFGQCHDCCWDVPTRAISDASMTGSPGFPRIPGRGRGSWQSRRCERALGRRWTWADICSPLCTRRFNASKVFVRSTVLCTAMQHSHAGYQRRGLSKNSAGHREMGNGSHPLSSWLLQSKAARGRFCSPCDWRACSSQESVQTTVSGLHCEKGSGPDPYRRVWGLDVMATPGHRFAQSSVTRPCYFACLLGSTASFAAGNNRADFDASH